MSKGPGLIETRIADLLAATRDRALSIDDIVDNAYQLGGRKPTREQRLSATRATHRLLRRVRETHARARQLIDKAHAKRAHPDVGGTAEMFRKVTEARDRLLAALGQKEKPPKMPEYYPKGVQATYRVGRSSSRAIGSSSRLLR